MTREFIDYEQALALKELGFDEPCFRWYDERWGDDLQQDKFNTNKDLFMTDLDCSAPLYQQAFRWFREKHDIQGYIYSSTVRGNVEKTKQFTGYIWNINGIDMPFLSTDARDELHDTYEEAEQACLIKLIEIVKDGKSKSNS
jgi:hypothetical protein